MHRMGYAVYNLKDREKQAEAAQIERWKWLHSFPVDVIFDIGANKGQFTGKIRRFFPDARILAFEPIPACFETLQKTCASDPHIECINVALSDTEGRAQFQMNRSDPSSSLLEMGHLHKKLFPHTSNSQTIDVGTDRLDNYANRYRNGEHILIKMDVQGAEAKVVCGGEKTFSDADVVITEISYYPFYLDQPVFNEIHRLLARFNLRFAGILEQFSGEDFRPLFADGVYLSERLWNDFQTIGDKPAK